jgi:porin
MRLISASIIAIALALQPAPGVAQSAEPASNPADPAAPAQTPANPAAPPPPPPNFASAGPFSFSGAITADLAGVPAGGVQSGLKLLTKTAVSASYDGNAGSWPDWTAQATLQLVHGGHPSLANIGDAQGADNIEAPNALKLYELWIARQWSDSAYGIKLGFTDLNVDFDTQQVAALFLNSSDGAGPDLGHSGLNGPSIFPTTTLAVSGFWKPSQSWTLRGGVFNGIAGSPDHPAAFVAVRPPWRGGLLLIGQAERQLSGGVRAEVGGWGYTAGLDAFHETDAAGNPLRRQRDRGAYGLVEGPIYVGERSSLAGWIRGGVADPVVQRISGYLGAGLVASGLIPSRQEDQAGLAVNHAIVDDPSVSAGGHSRHHAETAFEVTYKTQLRDWLSVQPDLQYIVRPNGDPRIANALVVALRFSVALTRNLVRKVAPSS